MRDPRMAALVRAIESRYPGTRVDVEPWRDPDGDPTIRWWLEILHVRERDLGAVWDFTSRLAFQMYDRKPFPFALGVSGAKNTRIFLAWKRARRRPNRGVRSLPRRRASVTRRAAD